MKATLYEKSFVQFHVQNHIKFLHLVFEINRNFGKKLFGPCKVSQEAWQRAVSHPPLI